MSTKRLAVEVSPGVEARNLLKSVIEGKGFSRRKTRGFLADFDGFPDDKGHR
ncbi:MAG: hypothetical protein ACLGJC_32460 [Alphaproteobacteria bacterium]